MKTNLIKTVGRRKEAIARVRITKDAHGTITVNGKAIEEYFPSEAEKNIYLGPLRTCNVIGKYAISIKVSGSGKMGQLGAVVHGMSRALVGVDAEKFHPLLRKKDYLTRDPRAKERSKPGLRGARAKVQSPKR